jgi:general secretion pathway protein L
MSSLIIYLKPGQADPDAELDYVLSHDGFSVAAHGRARAALLPAHADVVALVPAQALSWHSVQLPKGSLGSRSARHSPRLRSVLVGLLEEKLLEDPQQLHFALAPDARADADVLVAVCAKPWLTQTLRELEAAGRGVSRIVPELEPVQTGADPVLHVMGSAEQSTVVVCRPDGVLSLPLVASTALWITAQRPPAAAALTLFAEPACVAAAESLLNQGASVLQREQRWVQAAQSAWDLAQFDLLSSSRTRSTKRLHQMWQSALHAPQWRAARWGSALLLAAHLVGLNAWAWHEQQALERQRAQIHALLTQTFPNVRVIIDPALQMERELTALERASGQTSQADLESLLANVAGAIAPGKVPSGLDFANGQLRIKGLRLSPSETLGMNDRLQTLGLTGQADGEDWVLGGTRP